MLVDLIHELTQSKYPRTRTLKNGASIAWMPALSQFSAWRFDVPISKSEKEVFEEHLGKAGFSFGEPERSAGWDLNQLTNRYVLTWNVVINQSARKKIREARAAKEVQLPMWN